MPQDLSKFIDTSAASVQGGENAVECIRDIFVFEYARQKFALSAYQVAGVIPWRTPVPLPRSDPRVCGVIQDRGRIVVVMMHPTGEALTEDPAGTTRIIVCETKRGFVGLPATATISVGPVELAHEPHAQATVDSPVGALTYLDPGTYIER